jgi:hypothetical protein
MMMMMMMKKKKKKEEEEEEEEEEGGGCISPKRPNFAQWQRMFVGPHNGNYLTSPFWGQEFGNRFYSFQKFVYLCTTILNCHIFHFNHQ